LHTASALLLSNYTFYGQTRIVSIPFQQQPLRSPLLWPALAITIAFGTLQHQGGLGFDLGDLLLSVVAIQQLLTWSNF
jgi:hypothetical protein